MFINTTNEVKEQTWTAAELHLPQEIFHEELRNRLDEYGYKGPKMQENMMVRLVTHLMNYFCAPYKAIIRRFIELDYLYSHFGQYR